MSQIVFDIYSVGKSRSMSSFPTDSLVGRNNVERKNVERKNVEREMSKEKDRIYNLLNK